MPRQMLPIRLSQQWSATAQAFCLDAMMRQSDWGCEEIAFQGGTSLHLSWNSPRFSEDLDFLLSREVEDISAVMKRVEREIQERFLAISAGFTVELRDKTRDEARMPNFMISVQHKDYVGSAKIKVEFWRVDPEYLKNYPIEFRTPVMEGDYVTRVHNPVPAATLETAYCDKLTAFATRPYLKWRDVYDLWWIGTQSPSMLDHEAIRKQFLHNVTAYQTIDNLTPSEALKRFLQQDREAMIAKAETDLKTWMPETLWKMLWPRAVEEMVDYAFQAIGDVVSTLENGVAPAGSNLKRVRPKP